MTKEQIIGALKILGSLYRVQPSDETLKGVFHFFNTERLADSWPFGSKQELDAIQQQICSPIDSYVLDRHWQRLFIGPNHLEAPPWGSVYLDREQIVFGDSAVLLGAFLSQLGMRLNTDINEPPDHIGLFMWYVAELLEKKQQKDVDILLIEHLSPWGFRYLELLNIHAEAPFFEGLAELTKITLNGLLDAVSNTGCCKCEQ